ncbi:S49 family peptidase [Burkholderia pseudomallei]|uniref:S49 family peptidase n=1 Tax=Burkholderia pseudomallei TaxID=28450 RepID=UPI000A1A29C7|nr:S49 family peptidase [Burkholderia pseudomallei]ARK50044.1 peptidase S49 [Burkholderia pseudomallei]RPE15452.1 S49 family peptidase [Burkholderia pseudomallei]RPE20073.1 S49 family peptidase [Burkholderia pseudomallei]RQS89259.1 S49 family peptidase [Burkholderia pseudomallei]RQZ48830.1 S49 family peptidase [Burkholderia pseudomallei]
MKHALLISEFLSTPWALMPERLAAFTGVVARWSTGRTVDADTMARVRADADIVAARRGAATKATGGAIAVLPMYGVVTQRGNMADDISGPGSMSTQLFAQSLRSALADDSVDAILIDVDSPGGSVYGVQELADEIYQARAQKPVVAVANSLAASAAYWLGSAASEFYVTPGGEVGSIGVWSAHEDWSKALAEAGVTTTLISAGKYKTEGSPYEPLSADAQSFMQSRVDDYYGAFTKAVARNRGVPITSVRDGMGQGRVLGAQAAKDAGMVDDIATFDDVIRRMSKNLRQSAKAKAAESSGVHQATPDGLGRIACRRRLLDLMST